METRFTRRSLLLASAGAVAFFGGARRLPVIARQAGGSFAELDLPSLAVTASADGLSLDADSIPAGRYFVTLDNQSEAQLAAAFMVLEDGRTVDDLNAALDAAIAEEAPPPDWYYTATSPGGMFAQPGTQVQFVLDLAPGTYAVHPDAPIPGIKAVPLAVTGELQGDLAAVDADVTFGMTEMAFSFDGELATGPQVIAFSNTGAETHHVLVFGVPDDTTIEDFQIMMASFMQGPEATPVAGGLTFADLVPVAATSPQSAGSTMWGEITFEPGTYLISCPVFNPAAGASHAMLGMAGIVEID